MSGNQKRRVEAWKGQGSWTEWTVFGGGDQIGWTGLLGPVTNTDGEMRKCQLELASADRSSVSINTEKWEAKTKTGEVARKVGLWVPAWSGSSGVS